MSYGLNVEHTATCSICRAKALALPGDPKEAVAELEKRGWRMARVEQQNRKNIPLWYCPRHAILRPGAKPGERRLEELRGF